MTNQDIDAVITWVDGNDPILRAKYESYIPTDIKNETASPERYVQSDELYYCLAFIAQNANYFRKIFLVTDEQIPSEILGKIEARYGAGFYSKIELVDHKVIFQGYEEYLPVFNSPAIETMLHRIPALADRYVYFNDDCFVVRPTTPEWFFQNNRAVLRGKWRSIRDVNFKRKQRERLMAGKWNYKGVLFHYKETQCLSFELVGFKKRYFWHDHTPHPFYKPLLQEFFAKNDDILRGNLQHRIRNYKQFDTISLANALEVDKGDPVFSDMSFTYIQVRGKRKNDPNGYYARKIKHIYESNDHFACLQSFNERSEDEQDYMRGRLQELLDNPPSTN